MKLNCCWWSICTPAAHLAQPARCPRPLHRRAALATVQPKFRLFHQRCGAAPDACDSLAIALMGCPNTQTALALPVSDFEAALDFIESQAVLLPELAPAASSSSSSADGAGAADAGPAAAAAAAAAEVAASPAVLHAFFKLVLLTGGALLQQHPAPFLQHTAPWLRQQLGWCDADVAAAALLSGRMPELCRLDTSLAQSSLDWLLSRGLSQQQAGRLLLAGLRSADGDLLTGSPAELAQRRQRAEQLAQQWGATPALAAALWLTQGPHLTSGREADTGRLAAVLRVGAVGAGARVSLHAWRPVAGRGLLRAGCGEATRTRHQLCVLCCWDKVTSADSACAGAGAESLRCASAAGRGGHERRPAAGVCAGRRPAGQRGARLGTEASVSTPQAAAAGGLPSPCGAAVVVGWRLAPAGCTAAVAFRNCSGGWCCSHATAVCCLPGLAQACGSWQGVAAALEQRPQLLCAKDEAVGGLLPEPAQQSMWQVVAQMQVAE